jgi:hypothetical protein
MSFRGSELCYPHAWKHGPLADEVNGMKRREIIRLIGSAPAALLLRKTLDVSTSRA